MAKIDVDRARAPAFALADDLPPSQSAWHTHTRHQILYARHGTLQLIVQGGSWLLPPHRAAFLSAGTRHRVLVKRRAALHTLYITPSLGPTPPWDCRVFTVAPLAQELFLFAGRFRHDSDPHNALLHSYFSTVLALALEWGDRAILPSHLPTPRSDTLRAATRLIWRKLDRPLSIADLARAAGQSERTLRRHFQSELGMSPHAYLHTVRMLTALDRLADPQIPITTVALDVGFATPSAFSHAFLAFTGETPRAYRQRITAP